ncbi:MAG TPA: metallophosphoesterase family protein [Gaiellaceae bacterium]|nr:metallophosphoesterase family protein [Gaiellaceae bacterium]
MPRGGRELPAACRSLLREASTVLHTGDVTTVAVLEELTRLAGVDRIEAVAGNMDGPDLRLLLQERHVVEAEGLRIGLVHDAGPAAGRHERLAAAFPGCDLVAYGHTHAPEVARRAGVWIVNPGSPTERRRAPWHSLAVVRGGTPELVRLD